MLALVILAVALFGAYVAFVPCENIVPMFTDSERLRTTESTELLEAARKVYIQNKNLDPRLADYIPPPVRVLSISGQWASLEVSAPIADLTNRTAYSLAWQQIFVRHHGGNIDTCAYMHFVWNGGSHTDYCCLPSL